MARAAVSEPNRFAAPAEKALGLGEALFSTAHRVYNDRHPIPVDRPLA
jgi:hypothetical protein